MSTTTNTQIDSLQAWTGALEMCIANIEDAIEALEAAKQDLQLGKNTMSMDLRATMEMTAGSYIQEAKRAVNRAGKMLVD